VRVPVSSEHGIAGCGKSLFFRRSGLEPRRKVLALNGLQPLKRVFSFFCCIFPQALQPCYSGRDIRTNFILGDFP
jgi:hypothetical protein